MGKAKIDYKHPEYEDIERLLEVLAAAYRGKESWFPVDGITKRQDAAQLMDLAAIFLPYDASERLQTRESLEDRYNRLRRSRYVNFFKQSINNIAGMLSQFVIKKDTLYWEKQATKEALLSDVNLQGANLASFLMEADIASLRDGFCGILVDNTQDETRRFLTLIQRSDIINFQYDIDTNSKLQLLVFKRNYYDYDGYKSVLKTQYIELTPEAYTIKEIDQTTKEEVLIDEIPNPLGRIPIVFYPSNKANPFDTDPPLLNIAEANITHYQVYSDMLEALHILSRPLIVRKGIIQHANDDTTSRPILLSAHTAHDVPADGDIYIVETTGQAVGLNNQICKDIEQSILSATLNFIADSPNMTATEANLRANSFKAGFQTFAESKCSAVQEIFNIWADWDDQAHNDQGIEMQNNQFVPIDPTVISQYKDLYLSGLLTVNGFWEIMNKLGQLPDGIEFEFTGETDGNIQQ